MKTILAFLMSLFGFSKSEGVKIQSHDDWVNEQIRNPTAKIDYSKSLCKALEYDYEKLPKTRTFINEFGEQEKVEV